MKIRKIIRSWVSEVHCKRRILGKHSLSLPRLLLINNNNKLRKTKCLYFAHKQLSLAMNFRDLLKWKKVIQNPSTII